MNFVDLIQIQVRSGNGGPGLISFMRARYKPKMGPDGGDGGFGGDVYLVGDDQLNTLNSLRFNRMYRAESGDRGGPNGRTGRDGEDLIIQVPIGTIIVDEETGEQVGEVLAHDETVLVAKGGKRGIGNIRFTSSTQQAPFKHTVGGQGIERKLRLELKLLADVGFAGFPNAGKSTLLSRITSARPKVADYPFTTLVPHLGVVDFRDEGDVTGKGFVACDVPGLVEGASLGKGLGLEFLRHLDRTKLIAYVIDTFDPTEQTAVDALMKLRHELATYSDELARKPALVVLNKVDMAEEGCDWDKIEAPIRELGLPIIRISGLRGDQLKELKFTLFKMIQDINAAQLN